MPVITGPLLSLKASGSIGKTLTLGRRRGTNVARQRVVPKNPNSLAQQRTRALYKILSNTYLNAGFDFQSTFTGATGKNNPSGLVTFLAANTKALKGKTNLTDFVFGVPINAGVPCPAFTLTPLASGFIIDIPKALTAAGWTGDFAEAFAIEQQIPYIGTYIPILEVAAGSPPFSQIVTGLQSGHQYVVGAWYFLRKPNGQGCQGRQFSALVTPT